MTVQGNQRFSKETILRRAGLKLRDNILSVNLNMLRCKLISHPWIAGAEIERELPDAIHIQVRERVAIAIVDLSRPARLAAHEGAGVWTKLFYLDESGEIFKPVDPSDKVRVPVVTGLALSDIDFNDESRSRFFRAAMEVLRLSRFHQEAIPLQTFERVHVDRETGLTLYTLFSPRNLPVTPASTGKAETREQASRTSVAIKVGFGDYGLKYSRLGDIVSYLKKEGGFLNLQSIDLNDSDRVVVRLSPAGQAGTRSVAAGDDLWSNSRKEV
ncbi:MAG TPA: FtsQ-type POTRA domain-containing protein [Desulfobacterales bacterium]|nr:FtsQ-type POTRA domain-containing protein [Desulfobacterales bacterium]